MATDEETRAAAEREKEKTKTAKELLNVPAPPRNTAASQPSGNNTAATQPNGNGTQSVTFDLPPNLPPEPGRKPTILDGVRNLSEDKLSSKLFVILKEAKNADDM